MNLKIRKIKVIIMKMVIRKVNVNIVGDDVNAKIAEEVVFVNMGEIKEFAKIAEEVVFVNIVGKEVNAKTAEVVQIQSMLQKKQKKTKEYDNYRRKM